MPERSRSSTTPGTARPPRTARGSTGTRTATGRRTTSTRASTRRAAPTRATTRRSSTSRWRRSPRPASTRSCRPGGAEARPRTRGCQLVLAAARRHHLQPAIHLEPYGGRSPASVLLDLKYLATLGVRDVYVYHPRDFASADWAAMRPQVPRVAAALRGDRARRLRGRRALRRLLHVRLHQLRRRQVHPPLQPGPRGAPALRAERRPRLRRGPRRRVARAQRAPRRRRPTTTSGRRPWPRSRTS